jgi:P22_AR N-terminal domain
VDHSDVPTILQQHTVSVPHWTDEHGEPIEVTIVLTADGRAYLPIGLLCTTVLHLDPRPQLDRLREHAVLSQLVCQLRIETAGGPQQVWCIERRGIGFWWGGIQLSKVRREVQDRLLEHQWALVDAADRLLFGELETTSARAQLTTHEAQIASVTRFALKLEERIGRLETTIFDDGSGK